MDFYTAWKYLEEHPIFCGRFLEGLDVLVVKVDPNTNAVEDDYTRNTKTQIWLETGPCFPGAPLTEWSHDINLDCGGDTFEKAIIRLAGLVHKNYD